MTGPSIAPPPDPDKPVFLAANRMGNHSKGVSIGVMDPTRNYDDIGFCFQGEQLPIPEEIITFILEAKLKDDEDKAAGDARFDAGLKSDLERNKREVHRLLGIEYKAPTFP